MNFLQRFNRHNRKGFTLVELMIGMVVLMIGVMATMAMQSSALAGYSATRDGTAAADLGRSIEQMIKVEAIGWTGLTFNITSPSYVNIDDALTDGNAVLGSSSLLEKVSASPWEWHPLTSSPTDNGLSVNGTRRFCSYIYGGRRTPTTAIAGVSMSMLIVRIAVVYPAARGRFDGDQCPVPGSLALNASNTDQLEIQGLRASFFATQVYPRGL